jgi:hypothetical protein
VETAVNKNSGIPDVIKEEPEVLLIDRNASPSSFFRKAWFCCTHWETWDWRIKYLLIAPAWLWFCLRARSFWFFTASNPTLTFGGFDGESKREMYAQLPVGTYPRTIFVAGTSTTDEALRMIKDHKFIFPFAVKPDVGKMGLMFRRIHSPEELCAYHQRLKCDYLIQEWVDLPLEVSVFYYRLPYQKKGAITGFVRKDYLEVTGDGRSTLWQLILDYPRARFRLNEMRLKHKDKLRHVLCSGEKYCLSPALNLSRGGRLVSLEHEKDDRLSALFDRFSLHAGSFYYGRYDVKCRSIEDLKKGKHFAILEYNGSGAEPHHVYGNGCSLLGACSVLVGHWEKLFRISQLNNKDGIEYWSLRRGWKFLQQTARHHERLMQLDRQTSHN